MIPGHTDIFVWERYRDNYSTTDAYASTALVHTSRSEYGIFSYEVGGSYSSEHSYPQCDMYLYATSDNTTSFSTTTWENVSIAPLYNNFPSNSTVSYHAEIRHSAIGRMRSFAIHIYSDDPYEAEYNVKGKFFNYSTGDSQDLTIREGSALGRFRWISFDGGIVGG